MKVKEYRQAARGSAAAVAAILAAFAWQSWLLRAGDPIAGAIVLAMAGALVLYAVRTIGDRGVGASPWSRRQLLAVMTAILLLGSLMRLWDLASIPQGVWFDEAENGLVATRILTEVSYKPIYISDLTQLPALFFYYLAGWIGLIGSNILAVRLASAAVGVLTIPGIYLLGRELFGQRVGVIAAFLLSLSRWHVNFSRFGMNGIAAPFFIVYSLYFLARGLRTRDRLDFAVGGLAVGLGLNTYLAFDVAPLLVIVWIAHRLIVERSAAIREHGVSLILAALIAVVVILPLGVFAVRHGGEVFERTRTASLFVGKTPEQAQAAFVSNLVKHVEMFNFRGDNNGRHNLAGAPELDDGTAALFVLGLVIAGARWRAPRFLLLILWLVLLLTPAILSLDFEAPQSYRSIGVIPATSLLAALPVAYCWQGLHRWLGTVAPRVPDLLVALGLVGIGASNAQMYWFHQVWDAATWPAFSTQETLIAREVVRLGLTYRVLMDPIFLNTPTIRFLAPQFTDTRALDPVRDLPLHDQRDTVVFASDLNAAWIDAVRRDYPNATFKSYQLNPRSPPILYEAIVPAEQVRSVQGVLGTYTIERPGSRQTVYSRGDPAIDFAWSKSLPLDPPFSVEWRATLSVPRYGTYLLKLDAPAGSQLKLDETPIIRGGEQTAIPLAEGSHALALTVPVPAPQDVRILWQPPDGVLAPIPTTALFMPPIHNRGLLARYFRGADWQGAPALEQIDPVVSTYFHLLPLPQPFTVEWVGKIDLPVAGVYRFGTQSIDSSWLYVDGQLIVDNSRELDRYVEGAVNLTDGLHDIRIRFLDRSGHSFINVFWQPPGTERTRLPGDRLFPPQGAYPERAGPLAAGSPANPLAPALPSAPPSQVPQAPATLPVSALTLRQTVGKPGDDAGGLVDPRGVAVDRQGNIFIVNTGRRRVEEYDGRGKFVRSLGGPEDTRGGLSEPVDIVITPGGEIAVLDATDGWIVRYAPDGKLLGRFGGPAVGFYHPRSIAVDAAGNYYVADTGTGHVVIFDPTGNLVEKVDLNREKASKPIQPVGIAVNSEGRIYITDAGNYRLTEYDPGFQAVRSWVLPAFSSVEGDHVAVGADGSVFVSDTPGHRIIRIDSQGKLADQIGASGQMDQPVGVALGAAGEVYVADASAQRVAIYRR